MMASSPQQETGVSVGMTADGGASLNAPVLTGNTIAGPIHISYNMPSIERQESLDMSGKNIEDESKLQEFLKNHKSNMKTKAEHICDVKKKEKTYLMDIYTEVYFVEGDVKGVNEEHESQQIDETLNSKQQQDRQIHCNDIFRSLGPNTNKRKVVLTKGITGIGKTVSVHKFLLDWAEGKANQDIDAMFLLPFREINLIKDEKIGFHQFLSKMYPGLKEMGNTILYKKCNLAFIFDGLDESRLPFDFEGDIVTDVEEKATVDELFTNLVKGHLLPSALVWVTSRPAAANQIPSEYVDLFTEVQGFTDKQKEEYFRKRIKDEAKASRIISHIKTSRSLYIMCHIPMFCWIMVIVLLKTLENNTEEIPTTLTEMYIHFFLIQINMKNRKHDSKADRNYTKLSDSDKAMVVKLAKLAFEQLKNEHTMFDEEELKKCGIDSSEDLTESTGMLTEVFKKEAGLHETRSFCFVHLSVQEFLAALHVFINYLNKNLDALQFFHDKPVFEKMEPMEFRKLLRRATKKLDFHSLLNNAVDRAIESETGHLNLFLRFLLGISLESNQKLLNALFSKTKDRTETITKVQEHIKKQLENQNIPAEASVNLYYCLLELKDKSLHEEIQQYRSLGRSSGRELSASMCSVLTYLVLVSEEVLDEFYLRTYNTSPANYSRLIPAVRCCRKAILSGCDLTDECCDSVSSALQTSNSPLIELDMSHNNLQDSGIKLISDGLKSSNCTLETLRLSDCMVTEEGCSSLASALRANPSHIRQLDLSYNSPGVSGLRLISALLKDSQCKLEKLKLRGCNLTDECCENLSSALQTSNCPLRDLDLSLNSLQDAGVKLVCNGLKSPNCKLKKLRFTDCKLTAVCCESVGSALQSSNCSLRDLDLSFNKLQDSGVKLIADGLKSSDCKLEILRLSHSKVTNEGCSHLASALKSNPSHMRELDVSLNLTDADGKKLLSDLLEDSNCKLKKLRL